MISDEVMFIAYLYVRTRAVKAFIVCLVLYPNVVLLKILSLLTILSEYS